MTSDQDRWQRIAELVDAELDGIAASGSPRDGPQPVADTDEAVSVTADERRRVAQMITEAASNDQDVDLGARFGALLESALDRAPTRQTNRDRISSVRLPSGGDLIGAYRIEGPLGSGGMGTVYRARRDDGSFDQVVALKLLHRSQADEQAQARFIQERQILAELSHPHIARLFDGGVFEGVPYLVMEYIQGVPIDHYCARHETAPEERIRLVLQACAAMRYAHRRGVIHRDLKPSNLLVESGHEDHSPRLAVLDFGIALVLDSDVQVTSTGEIFGTPGYMSPEQSRGERRMVDRRSDVFSLGAILYLLLSGQRPFGEGDVLTVLRRVLEGEPTPLRKHLPSISPDLATIVEKAMAHEPTDRYDSVRAFADDLESYLDGRPIKARPLGFIRRWMHRARRRPRLAALVTAAATVTALSLATVLIMGWSNARALASERNAAVEARRDAEGLIDFMLQDLHAGLDRIGRLDLLEQVAQKSIEYYDRRPSGASDVEIRGRAAAIRNAALVLEEQGDFEAARSAHEENVRFFTDLAQERPEEQWQIELIRSQSGLASSLSVAGLTGESLTWSARALAGSRQLQALDQPPSEWAALHADVLALHGWMLREGPEPERALATLEEADQFAQAQQSRSEGQASAGTTVSTPGELDPSYWKHRRAEVLSFRGVAHLEQGQLGRAEELFREARGLMAPLVAQDPGNNAYRQELQLVLSRLGSALLDRGSPAEAIDILEAAATESRRLVATEPENAKWQREFAVVQANRSAALHASGRTAEALEALEPVLVFSRDQLRKRPNDPGTQNDLAWDLLAHGRLLQGLNRGSEARRAWQEAANLMAELRKKNQHSPYYLDVEVQALLELGKVEEARPLARQLVDSGWQSSDLAELMERHRLGD